MQKNKEPITMLNNSKRLRSGGLCACGALAGLLGGLPSASAEPNPYYFGGGLGLTHVSNIFRQAATTNGDRVATASLLAGLDQRFGRERLFGDASLQSNRYQRNDNLNNRSYTVSGGLDWATLERISGTFSGSRSQALASYNVGNGVAPIFKKNVEDNTTLDAMARLGLVTRWSLQAGAGYRSRKFSADEYASLEIRQRRLNVGLFYQPSSDLRLGISPRRTQDKYPRYTLVGGAYQSSEARRNDIDLTAHWEPSGASSFDARLSAGKSTHTGGVGRDFSGGTGQFSWKWQPAARWVITTAISRDTGLETSFFNTSIGNLSADQNRLTTALQISGNYELSSKIVLSAGASRANSDRRDEFLDRSTDGHDRDSAYNLGARYQYSRGVQFSCQISHQARDSSTPQYVYTANSYGCNGQMTIN